MANPTDVSNTGLLNLERELVCFICTETLYQPLTLIDCLHTFCGSCLKEWFSHQYRKASSSHSSSTSNPYTCPTCRATVKDAQHNAMVNTLLAMFLTANPARERSQEEKNELAEIYKLGDNILPKVEGRRRERRGRREEDAAEARDRRMVEEARERSLRDMRTDPGSGHGALSPLAPPRQSQPSRSREREERRERRREQERQERRRAQAAEGDRTQGSANDTDQQRRETTSAVAPATSPRHPEAVERRRTQQTIAHQASLASLISSSESGTGTGSSENWQEIRQEILAEGLGFLEGIDVDALTEAEQDALAERIAEAYRQRRRERNQRNNPSSENVASEEGTPAPAPSSARSSGNLQVEDHRRHHRSPSGGRHRRAETMPSPARGEATTDRSRTARTQQTQGTGSLPPPTAVVTYRRRGSSHGQQSVHSQNSSRRASPVARATPSRNHSSSEISTRPQLQDQNASARASNSNVSQRPTMPRRSSSRSSDPSHLGGLEAIRAREVNGSSRESLSGPTSQPNTSPRQRSAEPSSSEMRLTRATIQPAPQNAGQIGSRSSGTYDEPSVSCYQCHRADIQYEVYRHCDKCEVDLCAHCYRIGRGCRHWYGFGHAAMAQFEVANPATNKQMELPHVLLIGRQYRRPQQSAIVRYKYAKDGTTTIPLQTTSDPTSRFHEGRFCDRCNTFANSCFWACDYCNYGEWGFCRDCVNTHHCCTHPLLPIAHKSFAPASPTERPICDVTINLTASELHSATLRPSPIPSQPSSATSASSALVGPSPDYVNLVINTHCDICSQPIPPPVSRYHCPFHHSPSPDNPESHGDYDICMTCYHNLVKTNRIKREDGPAGWRKCISGHRMIITKVHSDSDGGQRRVVLRDLVGGWKTPEEAMNDWNAELDTSRDPSTNIDNSSSPESPTSRRMARARASSWSADPSSPTALGPPFSSSSRFPPDGGSGLRSVAWYSWFPDDSERGPNDLVFPIGAEIREIRIDNEFPDWCGGVYAGDRGLLPTSYLRLQN